MNLNLFDKAGQFQRPALDVLEKLTPDVRAAIEAVEQAANSLEAANLAAEKNAAALKTVQNEIAALEKTIPRITFNDLAKAQARDTQRRKMGLD